MNIYSVFVALLANSALAHYHNNPYANPSSNLEGVWDNQNANGRYPPAILSSNPPNRGASNRGSTKQYPSSDLNTPPYWYDESDGINPWYNNEPGTQKVNKSPNTVSKPSYLENDYLQSKNICYHGNQRNVPPATQAPYPPCWYKQNDGAWACFNKVNGQCPWAGAENPPNSGGNNGVCYHGNQRNIPPATQAPYPECWYKQSDGAWACFSKVNGQCPWAGAVGPQTSAYLNTPALLKSEYPQQAATCYEGNMRDKPNNGPNYPPCWYKQDDESYACFDKYKDVCPWEGALPPQTQSLLSSTTTPEYTESPGILGAIRNFLLTFQL